MNKIMKRCLAIVVVVCTIFTSLQLPVGSKTVKAEANIPEGYTPIYTIEDLYAINNNMSGKYILMNDLDLTEATSKGGDWDYNGGMGWMPIGGGSKYGSGGFSGVFDGNNFTIKGMRINAKERVPGQYSTYLGLFAFNDGTIRNLNLTGVNIYVNALPGDTNSPSYYVGGIAGSNRGNIENCHVSISLKGEYENTCTPTVYVGAITGYSKNSNLSDAYISCCSATGEMNYQTGYSGAMGGIVGSLGWFDGFLTCRSYVEKCFNTVNGNGGGGIVGTGTSDRYCKINDCYNTGDGWEYGISGDDCDVRRCYSIGDTTSGISGGYRYDCYTLSGKPTEAGVTVLTEKQFKLQTCFLNFDFDNTWVILDTEYPYPQLRNNLQDTNKVIDCIEWQSLPSKMNYFKDEVIDVSDGIITAYYQDGSSENIALTEAMVNAYDFSTIGSKIVTITYRGFDLNFNVLVNVKPSVVSMTLTSQPTKTSFAKNTAFDFSGSLVHIEYEDTTSEEFELTPAMTTGGNINQVGTQTITYTNGGFSVSFDVTVEPIKAQQIIIDSLPNKLEYIEGQDLDMTGFAAHILYNNGTTKTLTAYQNSGYESSIGKHEITISAENVTATFEVNVIKKCATAVTIKTQPDKLSYIVGQAFKADGMVVEATYNDGTVAEVTDYTVEEMPTTAGIQTIHIYYQEVEDALTISMIAKVPLSISITKMPYKTSYIEKETFVADGLEVTAKYNDGSNVVITDYELLGANTSTPGSKTVTVSYSGKTTMFAISVAKSELVSLSADLPTKLDYLPGESLDLSGLKLYGNYNNGLKTEIADYVVSGFSGESGVNVIKITSGSMEYSFPIEVHTLNTVWENVMVADCSAGGEKVRRCADCGKIIERQVVAAKGHTEVTVAGKEATCLEDGYTESSSCSVCLAIIKEKKTIPAKGHSPKNTWELVTSAGCTSKGTQVKKCAICDAVVETAEIDAKGHTVVIDEAVAPTCTKNGMTSGAHCSVCSAVIVAQHSVDPLGHTENTNWTISTQADCTHNGLKEKHCLVCDTVLDSEVILQTGHSFVNYKSDKNATCLSDGTKTAKCEYCDERDTIIESNSAKGHVPSLVKGTLATCSEAGWTDGYKCSVCQAVLTKQTVIAPKGHTEEQTWTSVQGATCVQKGITQLLCKDCGTVLDSKESNVIKHDLVKILAKESTCDSNGNIAHWKCKECQNLFADNTGSDKLNAENVVLENVPHTFVSYTSNNDATCTDNGTKTAKCIHCDATKTVEDEDSVLGHIPQLVEGYSATCTVAGKTDGMICSVCGDVVKKQTVILPKGHTEATEWTKLQGPTCVTKGIIKLLCKDCEYEFASKESDEIKHDLVKKVAVESTCQQGGNTEYWECNECKKLYADSDATQELSTEEVFVAAKHIWGKYVSNYDATCTENGTKTAKCTRCEATNTIVDEDSATGHLPQYVAGILPTCTVAGKTDGLECINCGIMTKKQTVLAPTGHTRASEWTVAQEATCQHKGIKQLLCVDCDTVLSSKEYETLNHKLVEHEAVAAGCETAGNIQYWQCSECENYFADAQAKNGLLVEQLIISATGHLRVTHYAEKKATYAQPGNVEHWHCEGCNNDYADAEMKTALTQEQMVIRVDALVAKQKVDISTWFTSSEPIAKYTVYPKATASVTNAGILTAKQSGKIVVTAYVKRGKDYVALEDKITLNIEKPEFEFDIVATKRGQVIESLDYMPGLKDAVVTSWSVPASKSPVATIDSKTGAITVLKTGSVKVTATFGEGKNAAKYTTTLKVKLPTLSKTKLSTRVGAKPVALKVKNTTLTPEAWISENEAIAKVDANGNVTAVAIGTTNIFAVIEGVEYACEVTVK